MRQCTLLLAVTITMVAGCQQDSERVPEAPPDAGSRPAPAPIDASTVDPDAEAPCVGSPKMLLGGGIEGELDNEHLEYADGSVYVLRRRQELDYYPYNDQAQLWRVAPDGSTAEMLHEVEGRPSALAAGTDYVYYAGQKSGIWRFPLDGAGAEDAEQVTTTGGHTLHVSAQLVYSEPIEDDTPDHETTLMRADLNGGNPSPLTDVPDHISDIAVDGSATYFSVLFEGLYRLDHGASDAVELDIPYNDGPGTFELAGDRIYYLNIFGRAASIATDGSALTSHGPHGANTAPRDGIMVGDHFYWANHTNGVAIRRLSIMGGTLESIGSHTHSSRALASDGKNLFHSTRGALWVTPLCAIEATPVP